MVFLNARARSVLQIWVHSAHNGSGYYSGYGEEVLQSDHFNSRLSFGDTQTVWARTGYLGFLRRTELTDANGGAFLFFALLMFLFHRRIHSASVFLPNRETRCSVRGGSSGGGHGAEGDEVPSH